MDKMGNKIRKQENKQQFSTEIVLAWDRMVLVKTKKSERILKPGLEMELIGLADYLNIRRQGENKKWLPNCRLE